MIQVKLLLKTGDNMQNIKVDDMVQGNDVYMQTYQIPILNIVTDIKKIVTKHGRITVCVLDDGREIDTHWLEVANNNELVDFALKVVTELGCFKCSKFGSCEDRNYCDDVADYLESLKV